MTLDDFVMIAMLTALFGVVIAAFIRFFVGPSLPDRVVALELLGTTVLAIVIVFAVATDASMLLNVATVMALTGFLGTVAFAYYIEQRKV